MLDPIAAFSREELLLALTLVEDPEDATKHVDDLIAAREKTEGVGSGMTLETLALLALAAEELSRKVTAFARLVPGGTFGERLDELRVALRRAGRIGAPQP